MSCAGSLIFIYLKLAFTFNCRIFLIRHAFLWYFERKVNKNSSQLHELRTEKKKILEQVQEKETYKVALEILNKFAERPQIVRPTVPETPRVTLPTAPAIGRTPDYQLRHRQMATPSQQQVVRSSAAAQIRSPMPQINRSLMGSPMPMPQQMQQRTPFPVIDQRDKGVMEKLVDYLIGDGPSNRFGMICSVCFGHNGMALQEDYEYTSFKCAFCGAFCPAKKQRPIGPRLERTPERQPLTEASSSTSEGEKNSGTDSDDETDVVKEVSPEQPLEEQVDEQTPRQEVEKADHEKKED